MDVGLLVDLLFVLICTMFIIRAWIKVKVKLKMHSKKEPKPFFRFILGDLFKQPVYLGFIKGGSNHKKLAFLYNVLTVLMFILFFLLIVIYFFYYNG